MESSHFPYTRPAVSIVVLALLVLVTNRYPFRIMELSVEDGIVENLTALLFALSGILFLWCAYRLRTGATPGYGWYSRLFIVGWGVLLILFAGEEISWGQRIFGFGTPERLTEINRQKEFNFHNLEQVHTTFGGTHRFLSMIMLFFGLVLPLADRVAWLRQKLERTGIPVPSPACAILFVGAYVYGAYYALVPRFEAELQFDFYYSAVEVRELILAMATTCYGVEVLRRVPLPAAGAAT